VDELHFAVGSRNGDDVNVAVVDQEQMSVWSERLQSAGIQAQVMVPDTLLLPDQENQWQLACFDNKCLLRSGAQAGQVMDQDNYAAIMAMALAEAGHAKPDSVQFYAPEGSDIALAELGVPLEPHVLPEPSLQWLARHYDERQSINLLQGRYSRRERMGQYWRPWRMAASLAAVWLVVQFAVSIVDFQRYDSERLALKQEIEDVYRQAFPAAKKVPNPKLQMERRLRELRGGGSVAGGEGFAALLAQAGQQFKETKKLELQRVSYKDGLLDVSLTIGDLQQLDALKQKLSTDGNLQVEIQSASAQGAGVEARLRIKGGAS
jgi:general secretion pathway protein L